MTRDTDYGIIKKYCARFGEHSTKEDFYIEQEIEKMSGHSKFANIKHKKEKNDAAKGKIFTRIGREIAVAVKEGGPDVNNNSKLKDIVAKAKANNMPNDTIDRSIKKAAGEGNNVNYEFVSYEGYGPSGIAIIVDALTDNKNTWQLLYLFPTESLFYLLLFLPVPNILSPEDLHRLCLPIP